MPAEHISTMAETFPVTVNQSGSSNKNTSYITQGDTGATAPTTSKDNEASVTQKGTNNQNESYITQTSAYNKATVEQDGSGSVNQSVIEQTGLGVSETGLNEVISVRLTIE
jgi:hypothetical protein